MAREKWRVFWPVVEASVVLGMSSVRRKPVWRVVGLGAKMEALLEIYEPLGYLHVVGCEIA